MKTTGLVVLSRVGEILLVYFISFVFLFFHKMEDGLNAITFEKTLYKLEYNSNTFLKQLNQLLNSVNFSKFKNNTSGLEYAKFCSTMAFVLCSLHYIKLKLEGGNVGSHPVSNNLNRIKCYMKQINDKQTQGKKVNKIRINKEAVKRIINSST